MSTKAALGGHVLIWEDPAGAIPGGGQYFYALVIVGGFAVVGWLAALLMPRNEAGKKAPASLIAPRWSRHWLRLFR